MKKIFFLLSATIALVSCNDQSQKAADELCDCLNGNLKKPSSEFKKLMKKVAQSETPNATFNKELAKLDDDVKEKIQPEIDKLKEVDAESMSDCSGKIKGYKVKGSDDEARFKRVLEAMLDKSGCEVAAGEYAFGIEQTIKNGKTKKDDEETTDDEDKPKKKKTTEDEE